MAKFGVINWCFTGTCDNRSRALAQAFFGIKIIIIYSVSWAIVRNHAVTFAMVLIPVEVGWTVDWSALTSAVINMGVEEEVVRALLGAADTLADAFVENKAIGALGGCALACAVVDVKELTVRACVSNGWVAFTLAGLVVPVEVRLARLGTGWFSADAVANLGIEVVRSGAFARRAFAATSFRIKVLVREAFVVAACALAFAVGLVPFEAFGASQGLAFTFTDVLIPDVTCVGAVLNDALKFASSDVPGVLLGFRRVLLRLADA